ncbi:MAG: ABC transporter ATP-binding protein [Chloroflexi bacterium]|nr:MAG: ABC transporter ATP-binding protein [Chloroflexota bacterium]
MGDVAIRAEGLGKQYRIGEHQKYKALRDTLADVIYSPFKMARSIFASSDEKDTAETSIWALKDVSFEIGRGEVVGIIGRNGAGKSTLLKILSCITEPTEGFVDIHGRVGSLLEVGTGFHPELTGRENIYLNGSIIGMKKQEIDRKFDEIVAFAEIEQFLHTPVKYYSSGMYMRLAFSVAAHLEPELLLVDEVLAVGDAAFQQKCLGKMGSVAKEGRTVIFVSHNMAAIRSLCQKCVLLEKAKLIWSGTSDECIDRYVAHSMSTHQGPSVIFNPSSMKCPRLRSATLMCNELASTRLYMGDSLTLSVDFVSEQPIRKPRIAFILRTHDGISILHTNNAFLPSPQFANPVTSGTIRCDLGIVPLTAGRYVVDLYFGDQSEDTHIVEHALSFEVIERDIWHCGQVPPSTVSHLWWPTTFRFLRQTTSDQRLDDLSREYLANS